MEFYVNEAYYNQMERHPDMHEADKYGFVNIQDKWNWWMIMYQNTIYILN